MGTSGHQIYSLINKGRRGGSLSPAGFYYFYGSGENKASGSEEGTESGNKVYWSDSNLDNLDRSVEKGDNFSKSYFRNSGFFNADLPYWTPWREKIDFYKSVSGDDSFKIFELIKDHSVKISSQCQSGTGWWLDFEIPSGEGKYPLKWFLATNMHVINKFRFKDNQYNSWLPITNSSYLWNRDIFSRSSMNACEQSILNNSSELDLYTESDSLYDSSRVGWLEQARSPESAKVYTTKIDNPKLVYSAINFLGERYDNNGYKISGDRYYKDFAVLELNFSSENQARIMTNGVFDRYYKGIVKDGQKIASSETSLNVFAPELMSKYNAQELGQLNDRYFIGGYPGDSQLSFSINHKLSGRFDGYSWVDLANISPTSSRLTFLKERYLDGWTYNLLNSRGEIIPGHVDISKIDARSDESKVWWDGELLPGWGYNYVVDNTFLGKGASGSMVVDQNGALLGLYRMYNEGMNYGFVEPVRGSWVIDSNGRIILPGFDLISGQGKNVSSYRTQLDKYQPNLNTFLRSMNWTFHTFR